MTDVPTDKQQHPLHLMDVPVSRGLLEFSVPIYLASAIPTVGGIVNSIWIGRYLGETALAAVSNAHSLIFLLTGVALGVATSAMILVSQYVGADDFMTAKRVAGTSASFLAVISIVLCLVGLTFSQPLLVMMRAPDDCIHLAVPYTTVLSLSLPSNFMNVLITSLLRSMGDSKTPFYFMMLALTMGVLLTPIYIFGIGPIIGAGILGAATATVIVQTLSLIGLITYLYRSGHPLCLHGRELLLLRLDLSVLRTLLQKGVPLGAETLLIALSSASMIVLVNHFGADTTAAFGASLQVWLQIQMPAFAIGTAVTTMSALHIGGQRWDRARAIIRVGLIYSTLVTALMVLVAYILDARLYKLFLSAESPAFPIASHINRTVTWSFIFAGIYIILFSAVRATGAVLVPFLLITLTLLGRFLLAVTLRDRWQSDAIWWSFPICSATTLLFAALYYRYGGWHREMFATAYAQSATPLLTSSAPLPKPQQDLESSPWSR